MLGFVGTTFEMAAYPERAGKILAQDVRILAAEAVQVAGALAAGAFSAFAIPIVAATGAASGAINTGTLRGSLIGAGTAVAFYGVGSAAGSAAASVAAEAAAAGATAEQVANYAAATRFAVQLVGHTAVGCVSSAASGGGCRSGAVSGAIGVAATFGVETNFGDQPLFVKAAIVGLAGGTGAALTGGKFGDGFAIAFQGYLFNHALHPDDTSAFGERERVAGNNIDFSVYAAKAPPLWCQYVECGAPTGGAYFPLCKDCNNQLKNGGGPFLLENVRKIFKPIEPED